MVIDILKFPSASGIWSFFLTLNLQTETNGLDLTFIHVLFGLQRDFKMFDPSSLHLNVRRVYLKLQIWSFLFWKSG